MDQNQVLQIIEAISARYREEIRSLTEKVEQITSTPTVVEYKDQTFDINVPCELPLDVIKSIPDFDGNIKRYVAWRQASLNAIKPFLHYQNSLKLYQAICMIRNKIIGNADTLLASHGTPLNLDAIIARLDFAYSDKRPVHVLEQELSMLRQGKDSILEFYNKINQKLTLLTNKNIMTYGDNSEESKIYNTKARQDALRIFITGLNEPLSSTIFSLNPPDLPTALAKTQELVANKQRYRYAASFEQHHNNMHSKNNYSQNTVNTRPFFKSNNQQQTSNQNHQSPQEPMDIDPSVSNSKQSTQLHSKYNQNTIRNYKPNYTSHNSPNMHKNFFKRQGSNSNEYQNKVQRMNHIEEESVHFLG